MPYAILRQSQGASHNLKTKETQNGNNTRTMSSTVPMKKQPPIRSFCHWQAISFILFRFFVGCPAAVGGADGWLFGRSHLARLLPTMLSRVISPVEAKMISVTQ